ncbi:MAG: hypothetical protein KM296_08665 [Brockia lithotrophica]|nr:hypothetical protein [Brockia lithotrophica]
MGSKEAEIAHDAAFASALLGAYWGMRSVVPEADLCERGAFLFRMGGGKYALVAASSGTQAEAAFRALKYVHGRGLSSWEPLPNLFGTYTVHVRGTAYAVCRVYEPLSQGSSPHFSRWDDSEEASKWRFRAAQTLARLHRLTAFAGTPSAFAAFLERERRALAEGAECLARREREIASTAYPSPVEALFFANLSFLSAAVEAARSFLEGIEIGGTCPLVLVHGRPGPGAFDSAGRALGSWSAVAFAPAAVDLAAFYRGGIEAAVAAGGPAFRFRRGSETWLARSREVWEAYAAVRSPAESEVALLRALLAAPGRSLAFFCRYPADTTGHELDLVRRFERYLDEDYLAGVLAAAVPFSSVPVEEGADVEEEEDEEHEDVEGRRRDERAEEVHEDHR